MAKAPKIILPSDRTTKQPLMAFCRNVECIEDGKRFEFEVQHDPITCPKCGATEHPLIGVMSLIHFLHRADKGPIPGTGGLRYQVACDPTRTYLATDTNDEAASDQLGAVNCPGCLKAAADKKIKDNQGAPIAG